MVAASDVTIQSRLHLNLLLVEDNSSHAKLALRELARCSLGIATHHVTNGEDALRELLLHDAANDETMGSPATESIYDAILLDLRLPRLSGLELLRQLADSRSTFPPVIVLSSSSAEQDRTAAAQFGIVSYLVKPVTAEQLLPVLARIADSETPPR